MQLRKHRKQERFFVDTDMSIAIYGSATLSDSGPGFLRLTGANMISFRKPFSRMMTHLSETIRKVGMNAYEEKRSHRRISEKALLLWAYFNSQDYHPSRLTNYGQGGLCFESDIFLKPGTTISVKAGKAERTGEGLPGMKVAEVRWCRERADKECFEIGVRYHDLYDY